MLFYPKAIHLHYLFGLQKLWFHLILKQLLLYLNLQSAVFVFPIEDFDLNPFVQISGNCFCGQNLPFSGWNLVVVYSTPTLSNKQINIYNGHKVLGGGGNPLSNTFLPIKSSNVLI